MIDLETLGTKAGCGILAIGACTFDLEHSFYQKILPAENEHYKLESDPLTLQWWNRQDKEAREESFSGTRGLIEVCGSFADWLLQVSRHSSDNNITVWGNGADFDLPILSAVYDAINMKKPWKPFNGRCYRTLKNLATEVKPSAFEGVKHTALADAQHQARHAQLLLMALRIK